MKHQFLKSFLNTLIMLVVVLTQIFGTPGVTPARAAGYIDPVGSPRITGLSWVISQVAGTSDGKVALLYDSWNGSGPDGTAHVQVLNPDGSQVYDTNIATFLGARATNYSLLNLYPIANGELIVTVEGTTSGCDLNTNNLYRFLRLNASGAIVTPWTDVSAATHDYNCYVDMAELSNGNLAFTYQTHGDSYALRIFQPNGTPVTGETSIQKTGAYPSGGTCSGQSTYSGDIAANDNGTFLITHHCYLNANFYGVLYNNDGTQITVGSAKHFVIGTWTNSPYQSTMALTDNNYMVAYSNDNNAHYQLTQVQPNGTVTNVGSYTPQISGNYPAFRSLGDGGFVAIDHRISTGGGYDNYYDNAVVYSNSGSVTQAVTDLDTTYSDRCDAGTRNNCLSAVPGYLMFYPWGIPTGVPGYAKGVLYVNGNTKNLVMHSFVTATNHTVTFNANGGTGSMSPQVANVPTALTANAFTRSGYSFAGWGTASGGPVVYADGATYSFAADITLYAQWTIVNHTVTFNANSGTGSMSPQVANVPTALTANAFTRSGYSFAGWGTASGGPVVYADGATYSFAADITLYAQWTIINHTVTFNANSGTGSMSNQIANVPTALNANTFTRSGYSFAGWGTASGGPVVYTDGATYSFAADITLYAQWTALPNHTVTFNANSGTGSMSNQIANVPTALNANTFTRSGYSFAGWGTASGGPVVYADGATYSFATDITLYAQWTIVNHTVTFNANGGIGTMSPQVTNVPTALSANTFTRSGYSFAGWGTASGGPVVYADGATYSFAADITLYAQWTALPNHTVTFDSNGGTGTMSAQIANVPTALTANTFTRSGYSFAGWGTASGGPVVYADGATYSFAADITLYAQWTALPNHTVTFDSNGGTGTMSAQIANIPTALTANTFTRSGYSFAGWGTASSGPVVYADGATYSFAADITLYAQWTALPNHTVTFNANGGTGSMSPQVTNVPTALSTNTFTRSGYSFAGWGTASGGPVVYTDGATYSFAADVTLYAQWTALPNHTVTFNANGGTGSMSPQVTNVPTALSTNTFTRSGYSFAGWGTASGGPVVYTDGATYSFAADVTLYAQWTALPNHTVTFDSNGGTGTMSAQIANIPTALSTNTFTRSGYSFAGWGTASGGPVVYADGATYSFAADITLYAQWTALPNHTVTFDSNGGTGTMSAQIANVPTALTANAFTRSGYSFAGWGTASGGPVVYADGATYSFAADITLYAQWSDSAAPMVTAFTVASPTNSHNLPIIAFTATDNVAVTGYLITESATPPSAGAAGWTSTAPTTYPVTGVGTYALYPWAKDAIGNVSAVYATPRTVVVKSFLDFNRDGKSDVSTYRPPTSPSTYGEWYIKDQFTAIWGASGDVTVPGDYNGDGMTDVATYRPSLGAWYIKDQFNVIWGLSGDIPVPGDYNGDGTTDIAIYRPSNGQWYIKDQFATTWGIPGDIPVQGDYNGDGKTDLAIYRPSTGQWFVKDQFAATWGTSGDIPIPADYNGDGMTDLAVYRPSNGQWYIKDQFAATWGLSGDIPIPADYNGDGAADLAVYRPSTGEWLVKDQFVTIWGLSTDYPLPAPDTNGDGDPYQDLGQ